MIQPLPQKNLNVQTLTAQTPAQPRPNESRAEPWWSAGLRFECLGCGRCCRGESGAVFMRPSEEADVAQTLGMTVDELRRRCETNRWRYPSLRERANGECIMLRDDGRCAVYPARPNNCRTWPFWPRLLESPQAWSEAAKRCPGMNAGSLWTGENIRKILSASEKYARTLAQEYKKEK